MRRTVVDPDFGPRMREMRQARGLSLRALATHALSNKSQLQAFETGKERPSESTLRRIDEALGANGELINYLRADSTVQSRHSGGGASATAGGLEFAGDWPRAVQSATSLWQVDAERRLARRMAFSADAFLSPARRWLVAPLDDRPTGSGPVTVGYADIDLIRQTTAVFRSLDNQYGGAHVRDRVVRFLHTEVSPLLHQGRFDPQTGRSLHSAVAELTALAGWTSYDVGLHGLAQRYLIQASRLAMTASDRPLGAEILAAMSHQAAYLRAADAAVELARAAAVVARSAAVAAIAAEAAVLEAHGLALRRDDTGCARALHRAERALDRADRTSDPQWIGYFDEAYLSAKFGHCFLALSRGDLAVRFAKKSMDMDVRFVRGRQFNLSLLAQAYLQVEEVEQAATVGCEAAALAGELGSARAHDYLRRLSDRFAPHLGLAPVAEFAQLVERAARPSPFAARMPEPADG